MAKQTINIGAAPNDGTGTPLRTSFDYCNQNFTELYTATGPSGNNIVVPGSATISGDLTVDTSTLKVDSANNRVGIGTASPAAGYALDVAGSVSISGGTSNARRLQFNASGAYANWIEADGVAGANYLRFAAGNAEVMRIDLTGVCNWYDGAGGTRMTLNATGLGVGVAPSAARLEVGGQDGTQFYIRSTGTTPSKIRGFTNAAEAGVIGFLNGGGIYFDISGERMRIDASGNVGIGVAPSAGGTGFYKTFEIGKAGCGLFVSTAPLSSDEKTYFSGNAVLKYNSGPEWSYGNNGAAGIYGIEDGVHKWYNATTGSAGGVFTPTQAMTLDASGNLLVGKTTSLFSTVGIEASQTGFLSLTNSASTNAATNLSVYSTGAAAFRFYVGLGGTVYATNTTISPITSDERLKQNIVDYDKGLEEVLALRPRHFEYKAEPNRKLAGFISQEVKTVIPDAIRPTLQDPEMMTYEIDWYPLLVKAIQELTARVQTLEAR